jgi:hypothetical protein
MLILPMMRRSMQNILVTILVKLSIKENICHVEQRHQRFCTNFGTTQKLYQDYCPMYDEGKVATG